MSKGSLIILSGPSGVGKDTIFRGLLESGVDVTKGITATTREKRPHEKEGKDYYFKTNEQFDELIKNNALLEWNTYNGNRYGTLKSVVEKALKNGGKLVLVIDINGAFNIKKQYPDAFMVFIKPPSMEALIERITKRSKISEENLEGRLRIAENEMKQMGKYDFVVENDDLNRAVELLKEEIEKLD